GRACGERWSPWGVACLRSTTVPNRRQLTASINCLTLSTMSPATTASRGPAAPASPPTSPADAHQARVQAVRSFNRLYTRPIGLPQEGYLCSPYSLAEVRVLYELAHRQDPTATELAHALDLDPGYLSRILRGFVRRGLLDRTRSTRDGREWRLRLTAEGQATF